MPDSSTVGAIVGAAEATAESLVPVLAPFDPLIALITTAIIAHFQAVKSWPTPDQVRAALPADYARLQATWNAWKPSGDGSLPPATTGA